MNENFIYAIIAIIGTFIGGLISLLGNLIYKFYEDKKSSRELVVKMALENWKASIDVCKYNTEITGKSSNIYPLEDFIIHAKLFGELINKKVIEKIDIDNFLDKHKEIDKYLNKKREEVKGENNET
jgi:hypothetical protein